MKANWIVLVAGVLTLMAGQARAQFAPIYTLPHGFNGSHSTYTHGDFSECAVDCVCDLCCMPEAEHVLPELWGGWTATGWFEAGSTANAERPTSRLNGPMTFNDQHGVQFNQLYLSLARDTDPCEGWDWGGKLDVLWGSDFFFTQSAGLELDENGNSKWSRRGEEYGSAIPQAYLELAYNNLSVKLGHFYTIIGYETVTPVNNFFYSHSYTMQYGEPFTHAGALATYATNAFDFHFGVVNGWDKVSAATNKPALLGGVTYRPEHERYGLALATIAGEEDGTDPTTPLATRLMYSVVFNWNITDRWEYVLQHDLGWDDFDGATPDNEWYGINQYLFYQLNRCWRFGGRFEWFRDDDGSRLSAAPLRQGGITYLNAVRSAALPQLMVSDYAGNYYNASIGVNWRPSANLIIRPEVRMDWTDNIVVKAFDDLTNDSRFAAAFDAILIY